MLLVVAGGVAAVVAAYAVLSPSGLPQLWNLRRQEETLQVHVDKARVDNARLTDEVKVLQGGEPASKIVLEKHAREELGYVRADEVVLTGLPAHAPAADGAPPAAAAP